MPDLTSVRPFESEATVIADGSLFAWKGGGITLIAEYSHRQWVLARGWQTGDRLEYIRRWTFADPATLARQVKRLTEEATADRRLAIHLAASALTWAVAVETSPLDA